MCPLRTLSSMKLGVTNVYAESGSGAWPLLLPWELGCRRDCSSSWLVSNLQARAWVPATGVWVPGNGVGRCAPGSKRMGWVPPRWCCGVKPLLMPCKARAVVSNLC